MIETGVATGFRFRSHNDSYGHTTRDGLMDKFAEAVSNLVENKIKEFTDFITKAEINAINLKDGWILFYETYWTENWIEDKFRQEPSFHIAQVIESFLMPERSYLDPTTASFAHFTFRLCCFGLDGKGGPYLEGLEGERFEKALDFCKAMDGVGWEAGDVFDKYPSNLEQNSYS